MAELFIPSNTARVLLVDENGVPYKAGSGGGSVTTQVNGVNTSDQTLVNFVDTPSVTWANPSGGIIEATAPGGGSGDVVGPASAIDNDIAVFNGATGKIIKDGGTTIAAINSAIAGKQAAGNYLVDPGANGLTARTALNTTAARTITGTANRLGVTNGDGVAGNPTLNVPDSAQLNVAKLVNLTSNGFVKTSAGDGTLSVDTATYLTAAGAVTSINKTGSTALVGAVTLTGGSNVTLTQSGQDISIAASGGGGGTVVFNPPGFRLSTTTGVPVTTGDSDSTTLFWTPYISGNVWYWDGAAWQVETVVEQSLSMSGVGVNSNYDVFYLHGTGLVLSSAWTDDTTRADALGTQDGVKVLASDHTKLWLGTVRVISVSSASSVVDRGGGVTTQAGGERFIYNAYNQVPRQLVVIDTTDSWSYNGGVRQANGASGNKVEYVTGVDWSVVNVSVIATGEGTGDRGASVGVGVDSTTAKSGVSNFGGHQGAFDVNQFSPTANYRGMPGLGYHYLAWLENTESAITFFGDNGGSTPTRSIQSGLTAEIMM